MNCFTLIFGKTCEWIRVVGRFTIRRFAWKNQVILPEKHQGVDKLIFHTHEEFKMLVMLVLKLLFLHSGSDSGFYTVVGHSQELSINVWFVEVGKQTMVELVRGNKR